MFRNLIMYNLIMKSNERIEQLSWKKFEIEMNLQVKVKSLIEDTLVFVVPTIKGILQIFVKVSITKKIHSSSNMDFFL